MSKHKELLIHIKNAIEAIEPKAEIILYGSRARGDAKETSDWDLLILVPFEAGLEDEQKFRHRLFDLELQYGQAISTMVKSKREWETKFCVTPLYKNILREGVAL